MRAHGLLEDLTSAEAGDIQRGPCSAPDERTYSRSTTGGAGAARMRRPPAERAARAVHGPPCACAKLEADASALALERFGDLHRESARPARIIGVSRGTGIDRRTRGIRHVAPRPKGRLRRRRTTDASLAFAMLKARLDSLVFTGRCYARLLFILICCGIGIHSGSLYPTSRVIGVLSRLGRSFLSSPPVFNSSPLGCSSTPLTISRQT